MNDAIEKLCQAAEAIIKHLEDEATNREEIVYSDIAHRSNWMDQAIVEGLHNAFLKIARSKRELANALREAVKGVRG